MCLIAFAIGAHPDCPLLLAANRDEFFQRPTAALHHWMPPGGTSAVWAGRDLRDGGTWLGFSDTGRVAMLTNVRSARAATGARSRGELPTHWLTDDVDTETLARQIDPSAYGGFNLVVGDTVTGEWTWLSNRDPVAPHNDDATSCLQHRNLGAGVYGLSNATLDTPWPKSEQLKNAVTRTLEGLNDVPEWQTGMVTALADDHPRAAADLPDTGVPRSLERALSSPFVSMAERGYGTRSSLIARLGSTGPDRWRLSLMEWSHAPPVEGTAHTWSGLGPTRHELPWPPVTGL